MLSRALTAKPRKNPKNEDQDQQQGYTTSSFNDYEDCIVGFMQDLALVRCGHHRKCLGCGEGLSHLTLRGVLRGSVGVIGESRLGMTEKINITQSMYLNLKIDM
ncbi:putative receptor-like protein kinase [Prunus yedoensis var. nudiflora]|uniref:Putative receptor-like protein kinase n=1 Tax=Prunus yedoensis var. nudiflora TaxID=2094558 RepID=A0A314XYX4_PRUYE|nr:putative receptor-like protein kinase [Prunus yedoensis var. nudiflora]